jgi:phosphoribosyl 1,2-cyclic phosphodiesterase
VLRFAFLGSGSKGNALLVESPAARILIDCGFSAIQAARRMAALGCEADALDAVLVTHEHGDHASGVARLARRHGIPVMSTTGTRDAVAQEEGVDWRTFCPHEAFALKDLEILPVAVPHDAREPVQFVITHGDRRLGVLTDLGHVTPHVIRSYAGCTALVLEANHDPGMLANGPYPASIKARVGGPFGHLSNEQAGGFLADCDTDRLKRLLAAHISEQNNLESLARSALAAGLGCREDDIEVAAQDRPGEWCEA